jgi:hypothetical protein
MNAATMGGAWKHYLESLGLGVQVYRDGAPTRDGEVTVAPPFVVVQEGIGYVGDRHGDQSDPDAHLGTTEDVQVDLYQQARGTAVAGRATVGEDYTLPERVEAALRNGRGLAVHAPWRVYGTTVSGLRFPIADNLVRHSWTVTVRRDTRRTAA